MGVCHDVIYFLLIFCECPLTDARLAVNFVDVGVIMACDREVEV